MKNFNKIFLSCLLCIIVILFVQKNSNATIYTFNNILNGSQEVPSVPTAGTGTITGTYNDVTDSIFFTVNFSGLNGTTTAAHFHSPALPGANANVIIAFGGFPTGVTSGTYTNKYMLTPTQESDLLAGKQYANIHTNINPGGEIRAQIFCILNLTVLIEGLHDGSINIDNTVRDTITVNLRNSASPYALLSSRKAYFSTLGKATLAFSEVVNSSNYYIQILHRNGLETWSRMGGEAFASNQLTFDFTTAANKAFGDNLKLKGTKYCIYSGDVNHDGTIDGTDAGSIDNGAFNFQTGYNDNDLNGDGITDGSDAAIDDNNAFNFISRIIPQ